MSQQDALLRERLREAALALRELRLERDALLRERGEPIAIVGMGCRLPGGADSPRAFWDLLAAGYDAIVPLEPRWQLVGAHPGEQVPRWAGLLTQAVDAFDPAFFGISPREARAMDPQQRLLLEVAWEALEDAGIAPISLKQSRTGVFVGACANDYADLAARQPAAEQDAYLTTGNMLSIAAGRLSYTLGLQGPCMTLDTACSSSLVAIHLACRSLRSRESELALAGGVSLILSPDSMTALSRTQALSPDGRCRTFDALANGYVRGEGCGLLVLKRLGDAQRDGDRIWAVIRGSAVNQDGRSTGLTAPNVLAQEALLRQALKDGGVDPEAVGYVETHGTGTSLGDPIEVQALREVFGKPRPDGARCVLGALKTNIGHLEGAAGVAGVIKAVLALGMERIPKNLHLRTQNAHIELQGSSLVLATEPLPWPRGDRPRLAGISGFGLSGTNAHLVLEEAPAPVRTEPAAAPALPILLSGRSEAALRSQAEQLRAYLAGHPEEALLDIAYTLACKRSHFEHRASIVAEAPEALLLALTALAQGQAGPLMCAGAARSPGSKLAFLFTGQGSQRPAMGRSLSQAFPQFRAALDAVLTTLDPLLPQPLGAVMSADPGTPAAQLLDRTEYTQPALFALQVALYRLLESLGVTPDFLLGHSVGEIAAAHVAGVLSLTDACRLVAARGRLMQALPAAGAMVALQAAEHEVRPLLAGRESALDIAAINGPLHTVVSGDAAAVLAVAHHFESHGRKCTRLPVRHAFHSPHMDALSEAFGKIVAELSFREPRVPILSSLTGERAADGELARPAYWVRQARATVQFQRGMAALCAAGVRSYVELGPRGVLCAMGAECLPEAAAQQSELVAVLRGEAHEPSSFLQALGRLHVQGRAVDFGALLRPLQPRRVDLPTYPFQRQRCWLDAPRRGGPDVSAAGLAAVEHPLLGAAVSLSGQDAYVLAGQVSVSVAPWLLDHSIFSTPIFPGAGFIDLALCAAQALELPEVAELVLFAPLTPSESAAVQLQLIVQAPDAQGARPFVISSRAAGAPLQTPWVQHGTGVLGARAERVEAIAPARWPLPGAEPVDLSGLYPAFASRGLDYGPAYQGLRAVWRAADAVYVQARLPDALHQDAARFRVHPALLDTTLHGLAAVLSAGAADAADAVVMLVAWQGVRLFTPGALELRARLDLPLQRGERVTTSLVAWDDRGQLVLAAEQVTLQRVRAGQLGAARSRQARPTGEVHTRLRTLPATEQADAVLELLRREVAAVLGLPSPSALMPEQALRDLGLDSLMAVELRNRLQTLLGVRFELGAIWRISDLREFAAELIRLLAAQARPAAPPQAAGAPAAPTSPGARPLLAPLSAGQQRLYFLDQVLELRHTYNLCLAFRLPEALDVELLRSAVEQLIARHEQLRVCFVEQGGQPRQRILPWVEPPLEQLSLAAPEGERDAALRQLFETESQKLFDLSRAPLFRVLYTGLGQAGSALAVIWHHIATDGASMAIFFAELSATLQALRGGKREELAAGPSYALYATRQREWLQTDACAAQRAFWRARLKDLPALELPSDRPLAMQRTERGGVVTFSFPMATAARMEALAKRLRSTPFSIVCAAWSALLARYSDQQDFAIGVTMAGRHEDAFRDAVGFFVNTLPLRCLLHGEPTGLEYIQRIHDEIWSVLEHQELPLDEIVRVVAPDRQPGVIGSPLFRTCVSYNEHRESIDSFAGLPATALFDPVIDKVGGTSKFDLVLSVLKRPQSFAAALEFSAELFDTETIERYAQHLITLLTGLVAEPERRLWELPLLTEEERQRILHAWNDTTAPYPRDLCLHQRFEAQAERTPEAVALVFGDEQLSYAALNERANQLAHRLRALGVGPDVLVALCAERSIELVVGILGILKAGGAYVPIDPDSPAERTDFLLQDTRPAAMLTQRPLIERLPRTSVMTIFIDDPSTCDEKFADNPSPGATPGNLAYVIYTSGSTGRPKGVLMEHHSVSNLLQALDRRAWGPAPLRTAMLAPVFFDMSVKPLFGALLYGHTLYLVDKETRRDGSALLAFFKRHAIAWSDCTPSILAMLVDAGLPTCRSLALQVLLCGGEALPTSLVESVYAPGVLPALRIINVYGPTETCVNVNANSVTAQTLDRSRAVVPMGRPFENTQLYVMDSHLQPVPVGVPGELYIGGVGLARGYLNRPELTAEKFIPNPFLADPAARVYKTGDLVRYLPDGKIEFLGRRDHQVKLRGYRIELGEIEAALASHPEVGSCVVLAREDAPSERRLVAYVVPQPGRLVTADALRAHLAKLLPDPMLPAAFVFLAALPLTRNGKVDRRALPTPTTERDEPSYVPPANPLEHALAAIFSSVLRQERVGRHDDFFALGGDSLLAVRAVTRAQQVGLSLTVNQLFRSPTLAKLCAMMAGGTDAPCMRVLKEGQAPGGVVLLPGAGGVFHRPHDIARALDVKASAFGLIAPALAGIKERPASVQELAALYAQDLIRCVPQGPLALIGYSFGGAVALEIAGALLQRQRAVDLVILLDARPGAGGAPRHLDAQTALAALLDTLGLPASSVQSAAQGDPLSVLTSHLLPDLQEAEGLRSFLDLLFESARDAERLLSDWRPRLPPVPVHLLRVEGGGDQDADYGWSQHGALASVQEIPGQHYSLLRPPYLETTMQAVRSLLERGGMKRS